MAAEPLTPDWWLARLYGRLSARRASLDAADDWYTGAHPAPAGYERGADVLRRLLSLVDGNYLAIVVDSALDRLQTQGFRIGGEFSQECSDIWQSNNLDLGSELVYTERLALGEGLFLVSPELNPSGLPTVTPEHPTQALVEYRPGSMTVRDAGLKVFVDDRADLLVGTLYLPDSVFTYTAPKPTRGFSQDKPRWELQPSLSGPNPLGEVPLVDARNRPRMLKDSLAEFAPVVGVQKRINKTLLDRMVMQEFSAFKQKWAVGWELPVDENGAPDAKVNAAMDRLIYSEDPETKFGQFDADDIGRLQAAISDDAKMMASIVPTPTHYLHSDGDNISAEQAKVSEAGLVSRVRRHMRHLDEPQETVMRLGLKAAGLSVPNAESMETVWRDPEIRTDAELADSLLKAKSFGVPRAVLWERYGATPQQVEAWSAMAAQEQTDPLVANLLREVPGSDAVGG